MRRRSASIIIGNYNYGRFLGQSIDSALRQTCPVAEVIVVDDGSTDQSREIIARYGDQIVPLLKDNGGMGSTYNRGFPASRGELVIFLDADDMLAPSAVESALAVFRPGVAKVHWPLYEVDGDGTPTGAVVPRRPLQEGDLLAALIADGPDAYLSPPTSGNAWARDFLASVLPMSEAAFRQHADMYLATLAPVFGQIRAVPVPLGYYRVHGGNDYVGRPASERNRRNLAIYADRCAALRRHLADRDIHVAPEQWTRPGTPYAWMARLNTATEDIRAVVPIGETLILVDEGQWGDDGQIVEGRRSVPFLERDGQYDGVPPDDETALRELDRMRRAEAGFLVFAWNAFWWLDHYAAFQRYLQSTYPCALKNERVVIFDLRASAGGGCGRGTQVEHDREIVLQHTCVSVAQESMETGIVLEPPERGTSHDRKGRTRVGQTSALAGGGIRIQRWTPVKAVSLGERHRRGVHVEASTVVFLIHKDEPLTRRDDALDDVRDVAKLARPASLSAAPRGRQQPVGDGERVVRGFRPVREAGPARPRREESTELAVIVVEQDVRNAEQLTQDMPVQPVGDDQRCGAQHPAAAEETFVRHRIEQAGHGGECRMF
jgi:glycosyltransferase involved in cell wall biosynthesis